MKIKILVVAFAFIAFFHKFVLAEAHLHPVICKDSYMKQGKKTSDLRKEKERPINCDTVFTTNLNGRVLVLFLHKNIKSTMVAFSGTYSEFSKIERINLLSIQKIYLPPTGDPAKSNVLNGADGYCFFKHDKKTFGISDVICAAGVIDGNKKQVYRVNAQITGEKKQIPDL